jgi:hypothetical protein
MGWDDLKFLYESKISKEDFHLDWLKFSSNFDSIMRWSILSCVKFVIYCMSMENCMFETWYELGEKWVCLERTLCLFWVENSLNSKHYVDCYKPWRGLKVTFQESNEGTNERLVFDWCVNGLLQLDVTTTWCWETKELCDWRICILCSLCGVKSLNSPQVCICD